MTDKKNPEALNDTDVDQISGGNGYLRVGDVQGAFKGSTDLNGKPSARNVPTEEITLGYTEVEWTY